MKHSWDDLDKLWDRPLPETKHTWFQLWRQQARSDFSVLGLPDQKHAWWPSLPASLYQTKEVAAPPLLKPSEFDLDVYAIQVFTDHVHVPCEIPGVQVLPLLEAIDLYPEKIQAYLGQVLKHRDGFVALNSALFKGGLWIEVAEGVQVDKTICLHYMSEHAAALSFSRHLIHVQANATVKFLEWYDAAFESAGLWHHVNEFILQPSSHCSHFWVQNAGKEARIFTQAAVKQTRDSNWDGCYLHLGSEFSCCDVVVDFVEEHAKVNMSGLWLSQDQQFHRQSLQVNHHVSHCSSTQNFRAVVDDRAVGMFMGLVTVDRDAQKTEAHQICKNLLLSEHARVMVAPQLQIFTDDVVCSHGAAVGQLDSDALFYLQSRGFSLIEAKTMLLQGFIRTIVDELPDSEWRQWCMKQLNI